MRTIRHLAAGLAAFLWMCALALAADAATAQVHIEWMRGTYVYGAQTLTSTGASVASSAAPDFGSTDTPGFVRITVTAGAAIVVTGPGAGSPTATQTNGVRLTPGMAPLNLSVATGDEVAIIAATDQPPTQAADTGALVTLTAAPAGTTNSAAQTDFNARGAVFGVNLATVTSCSVVLNVQGQDAASSTWYTILASAALTSSGFTSLTVYPGAAVGANVSSGQPLPRTWRVQAVLTGASCAVTGTVGASVLN